jgi:hypothetical protein
VDDDPEIFANYMRCVYLGDFEPLLKGKNWSEEESQDHFHALTKLFVLADKVGDLLTANLITDEIVAYSDQASLIPDGVVIDLAYSSTVSTSPLRALMRDYFVFEADEIHVDEDIQSKHHTEFFRDIITEYMKVKKRNVESATTVKSALDMAVSDIAKCKYHQHDNNVPRCLSVG